MARSAPMVPWVKAPDGAYVVGSADFAARPDWSDSYHCPRCGRVIHPKLRRVFDEMADAFLGLEGACPHCGACLVVVNK